MRETIELTDEKMFDDFLYYYKNVIKKDLMISMM